MDPNIMVLFVLLKVADAVLVYAVVKLLTLRKPLLQTKHEVEVSEVGRTIIAEA